jgi:hypothetical protein
MGEPLHNQRPLGEWSLALIGAVLAFGNLALAGMILLTDWTKRMSGPSFTVIVDIAPGWVWGMIWLMAGALSLFGQIAEYRWPARLGHSLAATVASFWTIAFIIGATQMPYASPTGIAAYGTIALLHCVASALVPPSPARHL